MGNRAVRDHMEIESQERQGNGRADRRSPNAVHQGFGNSEQSVDGVLTGQSSGTQDFQFIHPEFG